MESMKINRLEIENSKRIKAVIMEPTKNGLTVIGGRNGQGKTSVLDNIAWALGGDRYKPSQPQREGSVLPPKLHIIMDNGLVVERAGKNSSLKVIDPNGNKGGQQLLNEFVEQLALDLPRFMESNNTDKAKTLLKIIGVGDQLYALEKQETEIYTKRTALGQIADQKEKYAKEQVFYSDVPKEPVSPSALITQQQEILARNGENQKKRENVTHYEWSVKTLQEEVVRLQKALDIKQAELNKSSTDLIIAQTDAIDLLDESTEELEKSLANTDEINRKVRANLDKEKAEEDAKDYRNQYDALTTKLNHVRDEKTELLNKAEMPLVDLSVEDGELIYKGYKWDNMSGSDQLKVGTAIVRKLNPQCGFVLLDKLEQMDVDTLNGFNQWLVEQGLQAIATRVSTGEECSIIIEDGYVVGQEHIEEIVPEEPKVSWKPGEF